MSEMTKYQVAGLCSGMTSGDRDFIPNGNISMTSAEICALVSSSGPKSDPYSRVIWIRTRDDQTHQRLIILAVVDPPTRTRRPM